MKQTFTLTIGPDVELTVRADDSLRTWNGFAVPILTADQAKVVGEAICDHLDAGPSEGLQWEKQPCPDCGEVHTAEHSCEPLTTYGEA